MTPYVPFSSWWCCLNDRESNSIKYCLVQYALNPTYMERTSFDFAMTVTGLLSSIVMLDFFMQFYGLEYQLIPCGEDCFIDAVVFTGDFWPLMAVFATTDDFICPVPCKFLTFPA